MKGIVLAGGEGTRLFPLTLAVSKQLLPVYDKPMVYYPLSTLMLAGIRDILIIGTPEHLPLFQSLLKDGSQWGINLSYVSQAKPEGLAQAFILGRKFVGNDTVALILGDNIIYGHGLSQALQESSALQSGAQIFGYPVKNPKDYGIVEFGEMGNVVNLEEKPRHSKSNVAVIGLYFYDNQVLDIAKELKPSDRGELEITDVNRCYLNQGTLRVKIWGRGVAWLDMGTHNSLLEASNFIEVMENRQGLKIACVEEIAFRMKYINASQLELLAQKQLKSGYGEYLMNILSQENFK